MAEMPEMKTLTIGGVTFAVVDETARDEAQKAGIQSIERTTGDGSPGTTDTYTITAKDGSKKTFAVYNGKDGAQGPAGPSGGSPTLSIQTKEVIEGVQVTMLVTQADGTGEAIVFTVPRGANGMAGKDGMSIVGPQGPAGSDANVTAENIKSALGYTPADAADLDSLNNEKVAVTPQTLTEEQKAQARVNIEAVTIDEVMTELNGKTVQVDLLDKATYESGYLQNNGVVYDNGNTATIEKTSDYVAVTPGDNCVFSVEWPIGVLDPQGAWIAYGLFSTNDTSGFQQRITCTTSTTLADGANRSEIAFTIPDGAYYVRVTGRTYGNAVFSLTTTETTEGLLPKVDPTLTEKGSAADAKATGDALAKKLDAESLADVAFRFSELWDNIGPGAEWSRGGYVPVANRLAWKTAQRLDTDVIISCSAGYKFAVHTWGGNGITTAAVLGDTGWIAAGTEYTVKAGTNFTVCLAATNGASLSASAAAAVKIYGNTKIVDVVSRLLEKDSTNADILEKLNTRQFSPNIRSVNHRGYCTEAPENTLSAYRLSKKKGFDIVECDVSATSDGVPVLLHDPTVDRTSNGTGKITELTFDEVRTMDFGSWFSDDFAGEQIPTLEEFLILCRNLNLHAYLDLRGFYTASDAQLLTGIVRKCGMAGKVTWLGSSQLANIQAIDKKARLMFVVESITESLINSATALKNDFNEVVIDCAYYGLTDEGIQMCVNSDIPLEVWTVNSEATIKGLNPYVTGVTSDNIIAHEVMYNEGMTV